MPEAALWEFRKLKVWQSAKRLAVAIYRNTESGRIAKDYGLRDQMRRAAVSVCSNIAEGDERGSDKESIHFFHIARGSLAELMSQIEIAHDVGYLDSELRLKVDEEMALLGRMLGALIRSRKMKKWNKFVGSGSMSHGFAILYSPQNRVPSSIMFIRISLQHLEPGTQHLVPSAKRPEPRFYVL